MNLISSEDEKPIVKYDRRFADYFNIAYSLSKIDADLFYTVLSIIRERKETDTVILAKDIIERSKYLKKRNDHYSVDQLVTAINLMTDHVGGMYYLVHNKEADMDIKLYLFDLFGINKKTGDLKVKLGQSFAKFFFDIERDRTFTRYYLSNFLGLKSKYTKTLYRLFLDHYGGFTIELTELFKLIGIDNKSTQRSFINRLPIYIKQIEETGDFLPSIEYTINKALGKKRGNHSITFSYRENPARISEKVIEDASITSIDSAKSKKLICPYCGDEIIETVNQITGKKFWHHKNWKYHRNCELKNAENLDDMIKAIEVGQKEVAKRTNLKKALNDNPVEKAAKEAREGQKEFREQLARELASKSKSNNVEPITNDVDDPDAPFPAG